MGSFKFLGIEVSWKFKEPVVPETKHPKFRIVKTEYPNGGVYYHIEEWTRYYGDLSWFSLFMTPNNFSTHEDAAKVLTELMKPPIKPTKTVVEER